MSQLRALVGARVSVFSGPQKVSQLAQIETGAKWVVDQGHTLIGTFEDLGISASIEPAKRPDLGKWLTDDGADQWDVIVWSKMDRAFRSTRHCVDFAAWCEDRRKILVFAEDGLILNYRDRDSKSIESMMSELFVYLGSFFAQLELNRFKTRAEDVQRVLRGTTRWPSGIPPLGYQTAPHPSGKGRGLIRSPDGYEALHDMADKLLDGWSLTGIATDLNERGVLTNKDRARIDRDELPQPNPWATSRVTEALTSLRTQGYKMSKGLPVLDDAGDPIRMAEPTFTEERWAEIQTAIEQRRITRSRTNSPNPLLGIAFCSRCGASMARQITNRPRVDGSVLVRDYFRCGRTPSYCDNSMVRGHELVDAVYSMFLDDWGDTEVTERVFVSGEDRSHELDRIIKTIDRLRRESDAGLIVSPDDERIYFERMQSLVSQRTELERYPVKAARWDVHGTGQTFREVWDLSDTDRRKILVDRGVKIKVESAKPIVWHLEVPSDGIEIGREDGKLLVVENE